MASKFSSEQFPNAMDYLLDGGAMPNLQSGHQYAVPTFRITSEHYLGILRIISTDMLSAKLEAHCSRSDR